MTTTETTVGQLVLSADQARESSLYLSTEIFEIDEEGKVHPGPPLPLTFDVEPQPELKHREPGAKWEWHGEFWWWHEKAYVNVCDLHAAILRSWWWDEMQNADNPRVGRVNLVQDIGVHHYDDRTVDHGHVTLATFRVKQDEQVQTESISKKWDDAPGRHEYETREVVITDRFVIRVEITP